MGCGAVGLKARPTSNSILGGGAARGVSVVCMWWPELNKPICPYRYRSPGFHVQSWYDEVKDYTYPYPHECNPWCPERCSGPMCTHYTQVRLEDRAWPQPGTPRTMGLSPNQRTSVLSLP